tara:strand:- start:61 stop:300 length:240 start_codon:yes stop_codon:yes gene_type:complete
MATLRKPAVGTPAPKAPPRVGGGVLRPKMPSPEALKKAKAEMLRRQKAAEAKRKAAAAARKAKKTTARKTKSPSKSGRG